MKSNEHGMIHSKISAKAYQSVEGVYESMVDMAFVEQWVSIGGGVATITVVFLLWKTVKQMEESAKLSRLQSIYRFRPWIGPSGGIEFMRTADSKEQFVIAIKNYGELPASNVMAMFSMKNELPSKDTLKNSDNMERFNMGPLLPNMEKRYWFFIDSELVKRTKEGNGLVFIILYFSYDHAGGKSGYGMISHLDGKTGTFVHKEMWVD